MTIKILSLLFIAGSVIGVARLRTLHRRRRYARGRTLTKLKRRTYSGETLSWGPLQIPETSATQHFLAVGTTGSGKSLVQKWLMKDALQRIGTIPDQRALILDAKNDMPQFLKQIGVSCPVYTFNPFDGRSPHPRAVVWDIAADMTSPARALNLAATLIPAEGGGNNRYFTDAARMVVSGVIESFLRHSPETWTFSDLVFATLSMQRVKEILSRDVTGREVIENFLGDERTGYQVMTTVVSRMAYFRPIAAIWQRTPQRLSLREWLRSESVLLLGVDATARAAIDAINEILFRVLVEEIDVQEDSSSRRTWVWIDEARLSGPLLRGEMLPYLAVKGRSRGACLVLAFQDIEGFREAAGPRIAHEMIAQCSHKALLRMESEESASWASKLLGQYEFLDSMRSEPLFGLKSGTRTEQLARRETVLTSEFYQIPSTSRERGLSGFFVSPSDGAIRGKISGNALDAVVTDVCVDQELRFQARSEHEQILTKWREIDRMRLRLREPEKFDIKTPKLKLKKLTQTIESRVAS